MIAYYVHKELNLLQKYLESPFFLDIWESRKGGKIFHYVQAEKGVKSTGNVSFLFYFSQSFQVVLMVGTASPVILDCSCWHSCLFLLGTSAVAVESVFFFN